MKLVRLSSKPLLLGVSYRPFPIGFTQTSSELFVWVKFDHYVFVDLYPPRGLLIIVPMLTRLRYYNNRPIFRTTYLIIFVIFREKLVILLTHRNIKRTFLYKKVPSPCNMSKP